MKVFLCAMLILALLITGAVCYTSTLDKRVQQLESELTQLEKNIESADWVASAAVLNSFSERWEKQQKRIKIFAEHDGVDEVYRLLLEMKGCMQNQDQNELLSKISLMHYWLGQIPKNERLTLENIF